MHTIPLGQYGPWFFRRTLRLAPAAVNVHTHVSGVSGSGKSRWLAGFYLSLLKAGKPATLIDPHADTARLILHHLIAQGFFRDPTAREKLIYLDLPGAQRRDLFVPFNVLAGGGSAHATASQVMEALHRTWPALAGGAAPVFDTLVQHGVKVLVSNDLPLTRLYDVLTDREYRNRLLEHEPDEDVVSLFRRWYDRLPPRDQLALSSSTLNRVKLLTFAPVLKHSLGQPDNVLDFREILGSGKSVLINMALDNGETRRLLGSLVTVAVEQAALARSELPPDERFGSHHLILDEWTQFTAQSEDALAAILSQCRKYGLFLVLAGHTWTAASEHLRGALDNVGLEVAFTLGRAAAVDAARTLGRVDPKEVRATVDDHQEGVGMAEQWEVYDVIKVDAVPQRLSHRWSSRVLSGTEHTLFS